MAVLQMLSKMICAVEFLARVALPEFMHLLKVSQPFIPILLSRLPWSPNAATALKFFSTVATRVSFARPIGALVESAVIAREKQC